MATSGTISTTQFNVTKVIETAFRYCKIPVQKITAESLEVARQQLYLYLSDLVNYGTPLWTQEKIILPMVQGAEAVTTPVGTIDLLSCNYRTITYPTVSTQTVEAARVTNQYDSDVSISTAGFLFNAGGTFSLVLEYGDDGVTWTTAYTISSTTFIAGAQNWYDIDPVPSGTYFRLREVNGQTIDVTISLGNNPYEIPMAPLSLDTYTSFPNKTFQGRPLQYWYDKQVAQPILHLWPVPNSDAVSAQIVAFRKRHIMDVGTYQNDLEVPQRWLQAVCAQLAFRIAMALPEVDIQMVAYTQGLAKMFGDPVWANEADSSPFMMAPDISGYTA